MSRQRFKKYSLPVLIFSIAILNLVLVDSLFAQPGRSSTLPQVADIFLGKWIGQGTTPDGDKFTSQLIFEWTLNKNFIEVKNLVNSGGEPNLFALTLYGWQPVLGKLVFWSFDNEGTINEGLAELTENTIKHEWRAFRSNGEIRDWRSTLTRQDENNLTFTVRNGDVELYSINYKRQRD